MSRLNWLPVTVCCALIVPAGWTATYYIDFDGGADSNLGTAPGQPWKHCPGDTNATSAAGATALLPGDAVIF
jgi:hypothetical protein